MTMASDAGQAADGPLRSRPGGRQVALVLGAAFTLSAGYQGILTLTGLLPGRLADVGPALWVIPLAGFATVGLVLTDRTWAWCTAAVLIVVFIGIGIMRYEALLVPGLLTAVGWLQNDIHIGLLGLAGYLCVRRLRDRTC
jgi:hypothetical protein